MNTLHALKASFTALALLGASLGGAALAQAADINGSATSVHNGGLALTAKLGKPKVYNAVVGPTGVLNRGTATAASKVTGTGFYQVDFPVDVTACSYTASQGTLAAGTQPDGTATTAQRAGVPTAVFVSTYDSAGVAADRSFHLIVVCS